MILFRKDKNISTEAGFDDILMKAKFYMYKCRMNKIKPNIQYFVNNDFKQMYKIDKHVYFLEMRNDTFYKKWRPYSEIVNWNA